MIYKYGEREFAASQAGPGAFWGFFSSLTLFCLYLLQKSQKKLQIISFSLMIWVKMTASYSFSMQKVNSRIKPLSRIFKLSSNPGSPNKQNPRPLPYWLNCLTIQVNVDYFGADCFEIALPVCTSIYLREESLCIIANVSVITLEFCLQQKLVFQVFCFERMSENTPE